VVVVVVVMVVRLLEKAGSVEKERLLEKSSFMVWIPVKRLKMVF
jgi:hypothetical protein